MIGKINGSIRKVGGQISKAARKVFGKKEAAPGPMDKLSIGEQKEISEGLLQDTGVLKSSSVTKEKVSANAKAAKKGEASKTVSKQVEFKSGITVTEDSEKNTVTISQNVGGSPKTLAVLDDASLTVPKDPKAKGVVYNPLIKRPDFTEEVTSATPDDVVIENAEKREIIDVKTGTITMEDKVHGAKESPAPPWPKGSLTGWKPSRSPLSPAPWFSDRYTITPDGKVEGTQYQKEIKHRPWPTMSEEIIEANSIKGSVLKDGSVMVHKGEEKFILKPFITSRQVNG